MIKTIKVKKQLRLDELIKYAFDNDVKDTRFESSNGSVIYFDEQGGFTLGEIFSVKKKSTFTVEVEEDITEDTWFRNLIQIYETVPGNARMSHWDDTTTKEIINWNENEKTKKVYALIENKLELIWEVE